MRWRAKPIICFLVKLCCFRVQCLEECLASLSIPFFVVFHRLTVVYASFCSLKKGDYPENSHVVFCPNKQRSFESVMCFDPGINTFEEKQLEEKQHAKGVNERSNDVI